MLTEQRKRFVLEYLRLHCKSAEQAAVNVGYSKSTARSQIGRVLKDPEVKAYLAEQKALLLKELQEKFLFDAIDAREALSKILLDEESNTKEVITVAKDFLDRAGFKLVDWRETEKEEENKLDLSSLSQEELNLLYDITEKIMAESP
ncbi:MAG: terminase small subunit [Eubacteriales bacterium]